MIFKHNFDIPLRVINNKKEIKYKDKVKTLYKKEEGKHCFIIKDAEEKTHALIELE